MTYKQPDHPLLLVPGSIEFSDEVLQANAMPAISHVDNEFARIFQSALINLRALFQSTDPLSQPFVLPGSGSMGFDLVSVNFLEPNDKCLCISNGFFSDKFIDCLNAYDIETDVLTAEIGRVVSLSEIEERLKLTVYKAIVITHVDTSTGIVNNLQEISKLSRKVSPGTLIIVDGVCSVAVENIEFDNWDLDFVLTASQKALGVPPGLCIGYSSQRALEVALNRKKNSSVFLSFKRWYPVLRSFENAVPAYFATPPVQLINALNVSLQDILSVPLEVRFKKHKANSEWFKNEIQNLGLELVADRAVSTQALTSPYFPRGIDGDQFLKMALEKGVVFAGGMHPKLKGLHFRVGHMGVSVMHRNDTKEALKVIKEVLSELNYTKKLSTPTLLHLENVKVPA